MTQIANTSPDATRLNSVARLAWIVLILATLYLCYFHNLGAIGFVGPDEPRYAWIARDMAETGDWITPRLYGQPWFEKPVLYYWGAALSFKLFGVSEAAARFPSALAALFATLAMAWLAWRLYGEETARWLLLLLPTTVGMIGFSHAAATDMPFSAMLTIAMVFAARLIGIVPSSNSSSPSSVFSSPPFTAFFFGVFLGLATLAKGPAAILLSGGAVLLWAIFTKRWRDAFRCFHPIAIAGFFLTALPWYMLCSRRNPDFFRVFIIEHNFKRFLTPEFQHIQPFWFYVPIILAALFPWTIFLLPVVKRLRESLNSLHPNAAADLFFLAWATFTLLFFSISKSKLPGYVLPGLPPLGILLAGTIAEYAKERERAFRWAVFATAASLVALGVVIQQKAPHIPAMLCASPVCGVTRIWAIAAGGGVILAILAWLRQARLSFLALTLTSLLLVVEIDRFLPNLDPGVSARDAVRTAKNVWPGQPADGAATWQLNRSFAYQLNYYLRAELPEWKEGKPEPALLFTAKGKRAQAAGFGFQCVGYAIYPAVVPCKGPASASGLSAFGRGSNNGSATDRQPR